MTYQRFKERYDICTRYSNESSHIAQVKTLSGKTVEVNSGEQSETNYEDPFVKVKFPGFTGWRKLE